MKAKPHKSDKSPKVSVLMGQRRLGNLAGAIIKTNATPEAIAGRLKTLNLNDAELRGLVDFLNDKAERLLYGEHPIKMLEFSERAFLIAEHPGYVKGKAYSLLFVGVSQWFTSDLGESLKNLLKAKSLFVVSTMMRGG